MPNTVMLLAMIETGETEEFASDLIEGAIVIRIRQCGKGRLPILRI